VKSDARATVSISRCETYDPSEVSRALADALDRLGGISRFVKPGEKILLKPNLLSAKSPDRAITTHPSVLEALSIQVKQAGGEPSIGDSPGGAVRGIDRVWRNTGMAELSQRSGVPLVNFEASGSRQVQGKLRAYPIAEPVLAADGILNVPKMKTHVLTLYTGCIKNMFGVVPGFAKGRMHNLAPRPVPFSRHIVDIFSLVRPRLNVMDAVVAMEGNGPSGGRPRQVGAIVCGSDAVAVDAVIQGMMGYARGRVPTTRIAEKEGLGTADPGRIDVVGEDPAGFDLDGFSLPGTTMLNFVPAPLVRALRPWVWILPEMSKDRGCRAEKCGLCVRSCPAGAITMTESGPVVDRRTCIECLCCHEVCPENAVEVRLSWLARKFS
jgi:uncharacterized protein (DUF362 family)/NAD-dependent dihydropyrimidine dehydrogenase PreA subunit